MLVLLQLAIASGAEPLIDCFDTTPSTPATMANEDLLEQELQIDTYFDSKQVLRLEEDTLSQVQSRWCVLTGRQGSYDPLYMLQFASFCTGSKPNHQKADRHI